MAHTWHNRLYRLIHDCGRPHHDLRMPPSEQTLGWPAIWMVYEHSRRRPCASLIANHCGCVCSRHSSPGHSRLAASAEAKDGSHVYIWGWYLVSGRTTDPMFDAYAIPKCHNRQLRPPRLPRSISQRPSQRPRRHHLNRLLRHLDVSSFLPPPPLT